MSEKQPVRVRVEKSDGATEDLPEVHLEEAADVSDQKSIPVTREAVSEEETSIQTPTGGVVDMTQLTEVLDALESDLVLQGEDPIEARGVAYDALRHYLIGTKNPLDNSLDMLTDNAEIVTAHNGREVVEIDDPESVTRRVMEQVVTALGEPWHTVRDKTVLYAADDSAAFRALVQSYVAYWRSADLMPKNDESVFEWVTRAVKAERMER